MNDIPTAITGFLISTILPDNALGYTLGFECKDTITHTNRVYYFPVQAYTPDVFVELLYGIINQLKHQEKIVVLNEELNAVDSVYNPLYTEQESK